MNGLRALFLGNVWMLEESFLQKMCAVFERRVINGDRLSPEEIAAIQYEGPQFAVTEFRSVENASIIVTEAQRVDAAASGGNGSIPVVAVLNIVGAISQHSRQVQAVSGPGGSSAEAISNAFRAALADPNVKGIVLNVDSPGGSVFGIESLADEIFRARGQKPIVAQVNSQMASAAYWIGSQADEIVMTPGAQAGSIGAYTVHQDESAKLEKEGVKVTYVAAGKHKVDGNRAEPLSADAEDRLRSMVNVYYDQFVSAVARGRGVKASDVRNGYGEGGMVHARNAIKENLADRIDTLDNTIKRVASGRARAGGASAAALDPVEFAAQHEGGHRFVLLNSYWPDVMKLDATILEGFRANTDADISVDGTIIRFDLRNAAACYEVTGQDGVTVSAKRVPWTNPKAPVVIVPPAEAPAAEATAQDDAEEAAKRADFRRRRHANRMRAA